MSGINASGVAVGFITNPQGDTVPVALSGQITTLGGSGQAGGINSGGTVIGTTFSSNNPTVAECSKGLASNLPVSGYGTSINDAGIVAGGYLTPGGQLHAFSWSNGNLVDLGTLGGTWSSAYGINASGQIVGTSMTINGRFAAFLSSSNGLINLGTLGGANSYGMGLNSSGDVVGNSQTAQGYMNAFEWNGRQMVDLGTLGGTQSYAYGVDDEGAVVGYSYLIGDAATHGFMYSNGILVDLNSLLPIGSGWTINQAYAINDAGDILGVGTVGGQSYAVDLLPPILSSQVQSSSGQPLASPEPRALLLTGAGLIIVGKLSRRKRPKSQTQFLHARFRVRGLLGSAALGKGSKLPPETSPSLRDSSILCAPSYKESHKPASL